MFGAFLFSQSFFLFDFKLVCHPLRLTAIAASRLRFRACSLREPLRERQAQPERTNHTHPELVVGRAFPGERRILAGMHNPKIKY